MNELYEKLSRLQWLLHKSQIKGYAKGGPMSDTTRGQGRIIAVLKLQDGISTKDLSYLLGVRVSSLNELLAKLEKNGYITRIAANDDKRIMLVKLTEKGRNAEEREFDGFDGMFACLSSEEQKVFGDYIDRLIVALGEKYYVDDEEETARIAKLRDKFKETFGDDFDPRDFRRMFKGHPGPHQRHGRGRGMAPIMPDKEDKE